MTTIKILINDLYFDNLNFMPNLKCEDLPKY